MTELSIFSTLFNWISNYIPNNYILKIQNNITSTDLSNGWELIITETEKYISTQNETIKSELQVLKKMSNTILLRPLILNKVSTLYQSLNREKSNSLITSRFDASTRQGIIRNFINRVEKIWFIEIKNLVLYHYVILDLKYKFNKEDDKIPSSNIIINDLTNSWHEEKYQKNICGDIISLMFQSSFSAEKTGLSSHILGDIIWTIYLSLSRHLNCLIQRPLMIYEIYHIIDMIFVTIPIFIDLWLQSYNNTRSISSRLGVLPKKWVLDNKTNVNKINNIKKLGVDAKYLDGPNDLLWSNHKKNILSKSSSSSKSISQLLTKSQFSALQFSLSLHFNNNFTTPLNDNNIKLTTPLNDNNIELSTPLNDNNIKLTTPLNDNNIELSTPLNDNNLELTTPLNDNNLEVSTPLNDNNIELSTPLNDNNLELTTPLNDNNLEVSTPLNDNNLELTTPLNDNNLEVSTPLNDNNIELSTPLNDNNLEVSTPLNYNNLEVSTPLSF